VAPSLPVTPALPAYPAAGSHDLAVDAAGDLRPGWERVLPALAALGPDELARRQRAADRLMRSEGAGVVLHEDGDHTLAPWGIDVVPLVIDGDAWAEIARGLVERAQVLAAVLADLHGPRRLLHAGVVPVEALARHATTLWSAWHEGPAPGLLVAGADLVIDADGQPRVVADLTDVASGEGDALLARSISARVLPTADPTVDVIGHRDYLQALRGTLAARAPAGRASPRTVVVTGPPGTPGYVEDAYLATNLGYHLAESADVVVRGGRAWLRSLEGPEPIDVLLRRLPEAALDPVEDDRSADAGDTGVAGVVEAVRGGGVVVVNPYGTGIAASTALRPFLDDAARFLTGRPLQLPTVPCLWCGDPDQRRAVAAAPERYVLHDTDPVSGEAPAAPAGLDDDGVAAWLARIEAQPERYVAQQVVAPRTAPRLADGGRLRPGTVSVRTQVLLGGDAPVVLPGGHGRLVDGRGPIGARPRGTGKDVWVLGPARRERARAHAPGGAVPQVDLRRSLPTRAAEALYWTGRTAERAEMAARTVLVTLTRLPGAEPDTDDAIAAGRGLRAVSGGLPAGLPAGLPPRAAPDLGAEVRDALDGRAGSVVDSLRATVVNARRARQLLSARTWRLLAMLDLEADALDKLAGDPGLGLDQAGLATFDATEALDRVLVPLAALSGLANESVVRGPGWRFLDIGRRIERSLLVLGLVEAMFEPAGAGHGPGPGGSGACSPVRGDLALAACESLVAYRRRYRSDVTLDALGDLLLADRDNPRSLRFQLDQLVVDLHDLPDRPVRRTQIAAVRSAQRELEARLPLGSRAGDEGLGSVAALVLAVRGPLLTVGDLVPGGWFTERPRRVR
jgi:uncharacterized circularly permuted ATP-grasp superfamily protein/uncharacterized alpha-E superfamily protein